MVRFTADETVRLITGHLQCLMDNNDPRATRYFLSAIIFGTFFLPRLVGGRAITGAALFKQAFTQR
jgi:hypothetical protein